MNENTEIYKAVYLGSFDSEYVKSDNIGKLARIAAKRKYLVLDIKNIATSKQEAIQSEIIFKTISFNRLNYLLKIPLMLALF
jgi:hypothetical protein